MIVITLTKVPNSLRGDLTKWYQEIQTGVYVGNVSAKIRDLVWARIQQNIGNGQATMVYNTNNELGYSFTTTRLDYKVVDFEGVPLMMQLASNSKIIKTGFSDASKFHKAKVMSHRNTVAKERKIVNDVKDDIVVIDIETTGLDLKKDQIISIAAYKNDSSLYYLIQPNNISLSEDISKLTGLTDKALQIQGISLKLALAKLREFVEDLPIVGYNISFDLSFIERAINYNNVPKLSNNIIDLMPVIKKKYKFLDNYRLSTVLNNFDILNEHPHRADSDAQATFKLAKQLIKNQELKF